MTLNHFTVDWYAGILKPLLPLIMARFALSGGQVAMIPASLGIIASFVQPYGAILGMKFGEKQVQIVSILSTAIFTSLIGGTKSLVWFMVFLSLGRIGNSFFHPNGATYVGKINSSNKYTTMSLFSIGGTLGMAVAPIVIVWFVGKFSMERMYITMILGIVIALLSFFYLDDNSKDDELIPQKSGFGMWESLKIHGVKRLMSITILRSFVLTTFSTLIPIYLHKLGYSLLWGGYFLTFATLIGALGNYVGAVISDKKGAKFINMLAPFIAVLFAFLFLFSHNIYHKLFMYMLMSLFAFFPSSANISYMQDLIPHRKGIASSLTMGISWGVTSMVFMAITPFIDIVGIHKILILIALLLPIGGMLSFRLPDEKFL